MTSNGPVSRSDLRSCVCHAYAYDARSEILAGRGLPRSPRQTCDTEISVRSLYFPIAPNSFHQHYKKRWITLADKCILFTKKYGYLRSIIRCAETQRGRERCCERSYEECQCVYIVALIKVAFKMPLLLTTCTTASIFFGWGR